MKKTYSIKPNKYHKKGSGSTICEKWFLKGIFWRSSKLKNFPIDVQELTISLASLKPISEVKFVKSKFKISAVIQEGFIDQQEWKLYSFVACKEVIVKHKLSVDEYAAYYITAFTCRRPNYYYYNAFFLIFLITLSSMTTFSMPCHLPQSRLQTMCTVLLTSITFKWVINRSLPTVYYLTSLDFYSLMNILLICICLCWHAIIGVVNNNDASFKRTENNRKIDDVSYDTYCIHSNEVLDYSAFGITLIAFIILNGSFLYWYFFKAKRESKLLDEREKKFINNLKAEANRSIKQKTQHHYTR